jgi:hypothetical protein
MTYWPGLSKEAAMEVEDVFRNRGRSQFHGPLEH